MEKEMEFDDLMQEEDRVSLELLLKQYTKELNDLENGTGLAKAMSKDEISCAKKDLKVHIEDLKKCL